MFKNFKSVVKVQSLPTTQGHAFSDTKKIQKIIIN